MCVCVCVGSSRKRVRGRDLLWRYLSMCSSTSPVHEAAAGRRYGDGRQPE